MLEDWVLLASDSQPFNHFAKIRFFFQLVAHCLGFLSTTFQQLINILFPFSKSAIP